MDRVKFSPDDYPTGDIRSEEYLAHKTANWGHRVTRDFLDGPIRIFTKRAKYGDPYKKEGGINFDSMRKLTMQAMGYDEKQLAKFKKEYVDFKKATTESEERSALPLEDELNRSFEFYEDEQSFDDNEELMLRDRATRNPAPPRIKRPKGMDRPKERVDLSNEIFLYGIASGLSVEVMAKMQKLKDKSFLENMKPKDDVNYPYNRMRIRFGEGYTTDPSPYDREDGMRTYRHATPGSIHFMAVYEDVLRKEGVKEGPMDTSRMISMTSKHIPMDSYVPLMSLHTAVMILYFVRRLIDAKTEEEIKNRCHVVVERFLPLVIGFEKFSGALSSKSMDTKCKAIARNSRKIIFVPVILGHMASVVDISDYETLDHLSKLYESTKGKNGYMAATLDQGFPDLPGLSKFSVAHGLGYMKEQVSSMSRSRSIPQIHLCVFSPDGNHEHG